MMLSQPMLLDKIKVAELLLAVYVFPSSHVRLSHAVIVLVDVVASQIGGPEPTPGSLHGRAFTRLVTCATNLGSSQVCNRLKPRPPKIPLVKTRHYRE